MDYGMTHLSFEDLSPKELARLLAESAQAEGAAAAPESAPLASAAVSTSPSSAPSTSAPSPDPAPDPAPVPTSAPAAAPKPQEVRPFELPPRWGEGAARERRRQITLEIWGPYHGALIDPLIPPPPEWNR